MRHREVDVLVIGGGAAGLSAATAAAEYGASTVLVDREQTPSGVLNQCIHHGFGLHRYREELTGPEFAHRLVGELETSGAQFCGNYTVTSLDTGNRTVSALGPKGNVLFHPGAVVLATGARERPFGALMIPGHRCSGILTAGVAQRMVNIEGVFPGRKAVVLGSGDIGLIMARRLHLEGVEVVAVLEKMPTPGGLLRNVVQCLEDFEIPLLLSHTVSKVHGRHRLEGVTITSVDHQGMPVPDTEDFLSVDTLVLSVGLIPDTEIAAGAVPLNSRTGGFLIDSQMQTASEWLFAAGNNVIIFDLADWVALVGETAGRNAAAYAEGATRSEQSVPLIRGSHLMHLAPSRLVAADSAHLFLRVDRPLENARLQIGSVVSQMLTRARPSEMIDVSLSAEQVRELCSSESVSVEVIVE